MGELIAVQCEQCDQEATVEHHVAHRGHPALMERGDEVHAHCGTHHNECVEALHAVDIEDPSRYGMQWARPHPDHA